MKSKLIVIVLVALLILAFTSFVYAQTTIDKGARSKPDTSQFFPDEDYDNMIDYMREQGYDDMADYMESIDRDTMSRMHNRMHGRYGGTMFRPDNNMHGRYRETMLRMHNQIYGRYSLNEGYRACH